MTNLIKVDRTALDEAIKGLDGMFQGTAKVLADYEAERNGLEKRGTDLDNRLNDLMQLKTETLLKRDAEKDTSKYIKLSKQLTETDEEVQIIQSLQEQLSEDFQQLKQKYIQPISEAYSKDSGAKRELDVNATVEYARYEMVKAIADYAKVVSQEDRKIMPVIYDEFLDDSELMDENRGFRRLFDYDRTKLSYSSLVPNLLTRNNIILACGGSIDPQITKPKEVK